MSTIREGNGTSGGTEREFLREFPQKGSVLNTPFVAQRLPNT